MVCFSGPNTTNPRFFCLPLTTLLVFFLETKWPTQDGIFHDWIVSRQMLQAVPGLRPVDREIGNAHKGFTMAWDGLVYLPTFHGNPY